MTISEFDIRVAQLRKKILLDVGEEVPDEVEKLAAADISALKAEPGPRVFDRASGKVFDSFTLEAKDREDVKTSAADAATEPPFEGVSYVDPEGQRRDRTRETDRDDR